jgi:hypothetical protein
MPMNPAAPVTTMLIGRKDFFFEKKKQKTFVSGFGLFG